MFSKYLTLIGRTFIATYFTVNFFNIIPIDLNNNAWLVQVSMLLVDTASLLLIGLVCLKICSIIKINSYQNELSTNSFDEENILIINEEKKIYFTNKLSKYLMIFFLILSIFQSYIFIKGLILINNQYSYRYEQIDKSYIIEENKLKLNNKEKVLEEKTNVLGTKKKEFLLKLDRDISRARFLLFRGNLKVFIMSLIWAFGLNKLSKLNHKEGEYKFIK